MQGLISITKYNIVVSVSDLLFKEKQKLSQS